MKTAAAQITQDLSVWPLSSSVIQLLEDLLFQCHSYVLEALCSDVILVPYYSSERKKKKKKKTITTDEPNKSILKLCIFIEYTELEGTHKDEYWNNTELYVQNCIALATFLQITVSIHTLKAYDGWSEGQRYYKIEFMFLPRELCTIFSIITT